MCFDPKWVRVPERCCKQPKQMDNLMDENGLPESLWNDAENEQMQTECEK